MLWRRVATSVVSFESLRAPGSGAAYEKNGENRYAGTVPLAALIEMPRIVRMVLLHPWSE